MADENTAIESSTRPVKAATVETEDELPEISESTVDSFSQDVSGQSQLLLHD